MVLLAGSANRALAAAVARELGMPLGECGVEHFPDGELTVHLGESVRRCEVYLLQPTGPHVNDHLVELIAFADACRRAAASRIVAVIPYFGYGRSDKRGRRREPIMASAVAQMLQTVGIDQVITVDPHSQQLEGYFQIPIDTPSAVPTLVDALRDRIPGDAVVVAPDTGAVRRATRYAGALGLPLVVVHKERSSSRETAVTHVVGDVHGRAAIICDDMISTGGTIVRCIDALREAGARDEVIVAATHGLFVESARQQLDSEGVREVVVTDTIVQDTSWPTLRVVSIAPLLASAIRRASA